VDHAAAVGVGDRLAHLQEGLQQPAEGERVRRAGVVRRDGLGQGLALDEAHGVAGAATVVEQAVDGHDARVLQPGGDLGLLQEAALAVRVVGAAVEQALDGDGAVQLGVGGAQHLAETVAGVRRQVGVRPGGGRRGDGAGLHRGVGVVHRWLPRVRHGCFPERRLSSGPPRR
jgi:hypothetical protein